MNIDGSAREHTKTHTCQIEEDRDGAIYFVRRKFYFLLRCGRNFGPGYDTTSDFKVYNYLGWSQFCTGPPLGSTLVVSPTYEPQHYKTNKMICAPSEDSDQPVWPFFAVRTMGADDTMILHAGLGGRPGYSESLLGAEVILLVYSYRRRLI